MMRLTRALQAAGLAALLAAAAAASEPFPDRPIRMIVPFPPGTAADFLGRAIGAALDDAYRMQVVVDNRPGAGGLIGTASLTTAAPNGYTIGLFGPPYLTSPLLQKKLPYDPLKDGAPVVQVAGIPNVVGASNHLPVNTLKEFIAYARARPGQLNYGSPGIGSIGHFGGEILNSAAGVEAMHVPFKVLSGAFAEVFAGRVHYFVIPVAAAVPIVRDKRVRALAVTTSTRVSALPDVPTVAEEGLPAAEHVAWFGFVVPAGTPKALINKLASDVTAVVRKPETRKRFELQGADPVDDSSPAAFSKLLRSEYTRFKNLIKDKGIQLQ